MSFRLRLLEYIEGLVRDGLGLPDSQSIARDFQRSPDTVNLYLGQLHDAGQIFIKNDGRRRIVILPCGGSTT